MEEIMAGAKGNGKQDVTISLDRKTIQKAKILSARRSTSISGFLAHQTEILVGDEEAYGHSLFSRPNSQTGARLGSS